MDRLEGITGNFEMEGDADLPEQKERASAKSERAPRAQRCVTTNRYLAAFWRRDDHGTALRDDAVASVRDVIADLRRGEGGGGGADV